MPLFAKLFSELQTAHRVSRHQEREHMELEMGQIRYHVKSSRHDGCLKGAHETQHYIVICTHCQPRYLRQHGPRVALVACQPVRRSRKRSAELNLVISCRRVSRPGWAGHVATRLLIARVRVKRSCSFHRELRLGHPGPAAHSHAGIIAIPAITRNDPSQLNQKRLTSDIPVHDQKDQGCERQKDAGKSPN